MTPDSRRKKVLKKHVHFASIDSTSKYLITNPEAADVVTAAIQTGGYGKQGVKWISKKGGLWMSFIIRKKCIDPYIYVIISSVAVAEVLRSYGMNSIIKWPNDILVNGRKICGIIIDNNTYEKKLVVGIGININNTTPKTEQISSTSMKKELFDIIDISEVFNKVVKRLNKYLLNTRSQKKSLVSKWIKMQVDLTGKEIQIAKTGKRYFVEKINKNGTIRVRNRKGAVEMLKGKIFFV